MIWREYDYRVINKFLQWDAVISDKYIYLNDDNKGIWTFNEFMDGLAIHADMSKEISGKRAVESAKAAFKWIFDNTDTNIIHAAIPVENRPAAFMCAWSGMEFIRVEQNYRCYEVKKL